MVFGKCKSYKNWNCKSYDKCLCVCNSENTKVRKSMWFLQNAKVKKNLVWFLKTAKVMEKLKMQKLYNLWGFIKSKS